MESRLRGYRSADLSVYPVARGTVPLLTLFGAILLFHERPTFRSIAGTLLISFGMRVVCGGSNVLLGQEVRAGLRRSVASGLTIAAYTLVEPLCGE